MKRISLLIFAFLLFCLPVNAGQTVRPIITSGTVAAGGVLISAVNGTAFIDVDTSKTGAADFSTAILAAVTNNDVIELTSKTNGKKIYAYTKAAGSGTLGTDNLGAEKSSGTLTIGVLYKITATEENHFFTGCAIGNYFTATAATTCDTNNKVQQITAPSAAGVTLTNTIGGSTYNFALKDSSFTYNDTAGYNYRILSSTAYGKLIATQSPVSGTLHIATKDGEAMFFHDSIDFSAYAGTDAGSTKYLFVFYDNAGKSASAYAGAVGGGLTTDSNLLTNGDFETDDPPASWSVSVGTPSRQADPRTGSAGSYSGQISHTSNAAIMQSVSLVAGRLVCLDVWRRIVVGSNMVHYLIPTGEGSIYGAPYSSSGTWNNVIAYVTINTTKTHNVDLYTATSGATRTARYDDVILSYLTDVPATGLHLMSAKNGTTRNMKSMESGFNPNTITRVNIYRSF